MMKSLKRFRIVMLFALAIAVAGSVGIALAQPAAAQMGADQADGSARAPASSFSEASSSFFDASPAASSPSSTPADAGRQATAKNVPHDLSPWGMFMQADIVVKAVMIGLAFASLVTWTVWLAKAIELRRAKRRLRRGISHILSAATLDEAASSFESVNDTSAVLVREAADELRVSSKALDHTGDDGVNQRVTSRLSRVEAEAGQRVAKGAGVLATIGATAPFVGLFGTVWGIMNSFIGISQSQTTNLAVVAPGIAEALLATALGLVAAIPAVIVYNVFARSITGYRRLLGDASAGIERLVSRELDFRRIPSSRSQAAE